MYNYIEGERRDGENNRLGDRGRGGNFSEAKRGGPSDRRTHDRLFHPDCVPPSRILTFFFVDTRGRFKKKKKKNETTKIQFKNYNYNIYVFVGTDSTLINIYPIIMLL